MCMFVCSSMADAETVEDVRKKKSRKSQAVLLSVMVGSQKTDPRRIGELGAQPGCAAHGSGSGIVQQILQKSTGLLRRIIVPVEGHGGVVRAPSTSSESI